MCEAIRQLSVFMLTCRAAVFAAMRPVGCSVHCCRPLLVTRLCAPKMGTAPGLQVTA